MSEIKVDLVTPSGMMLQGTILPADLRVAEAVEALVGELRLPSVSAAGNELHYRLELPKYGPCPPGATLREAGIGDGERVHLVAVEASSRRQRPPARVGRPEAGRPAAARRSLGRPAGQPPAGGGLEVELTLPGGSPAGAAALDPNQPAGELVRQIVRGYNLPFRDEFEEPVVYRVESRALGRYLADRETLATAGVPPGDRLVVHRQEHAG